jgi:transcriptional regulator with XRE-family HTH domain
MDAVQEPNQAFGARVRQLREARGIGLRRFAKVVELSPTYLSKVERGQLPPPAEDKVLAIARELDQDPDILLAMAGRVATDVTEVIKRHPRELSPLIRLAGTSHAVPAVARIVAQILTNHEKSYISVSANDPKLIDRIRQAVKGAKEGGKTGCLFVVIDNLNELEKAGTESL